jgi:pimeloyl-ACP methyl ester carboxylesterase
LYWEVNPHGSQLYCSIMITATETFRWVANCSNQHKHIVCSHHMFSHDTQHMGATKATIQGFLATSQFIATHFRSIELLSRRPSNRTLILWATACYGIAELVHYCKFVVKYHRFNNMRIANHTRKQIEETVDQLLIHTPETFQRTAQYSATAHLTDKESLVDMMWVDPSNPSTDPSTQLWVGRSILFRQYKPVFFHWIRSTLYRAGTIAMRRAGYVPRIHATEIGDYTVWSRVIPDTKPIILFPGYGLGAVPYHGVLRDFGRTVHIVEIPNIGFNTATDAPGYITSDTVYRVVRAHVGDEPHDIVAHSLGSSQAAHYINHQHTHHTTPPDQTAVICDGFVCPVDSIISHLYPFVDYPMYREMMRHRETRIPWREFISFLWFATHDLDGQIFCKRFHNFYDGTLWRPDYETNIRYVFGERDMLYDVPYIKSVVSQSYVEREKYTFIPKARHGGCFFGKGGLPPPLRPPRPVNILSNGN